MWRPDVAIRRKGKPRAARSEGLFGRLGRACSDKSICIGQECAMWRDDMLAREGKGVHREVQSTACMDAKAHTDKRTPEAKSRVLATLQSSAAGEEDTQE